MKSCLRPASLRATLWLLLFTAMGAQADQPAVGFKPLFNGKDLTGWKADDSTRFKVENGQIIGFQNDGKGANLFTEERFENFELRFSYKIKWPANSGIWFRDHYQFDLLKYKAPKTFSGAFYYPKCPDTFVWTNPDEGLEKQNDWNDARIYANGNRIIFWLNGHLLGDQTLDPETSRIFPEGRIGLQVHGGNGFKGMEIALRSIEIRPLQPDEQPVLPATTKLDPVFQSGDRVALLGGGLIERARLNGHIESALHLAAGPGVHNLRFRNLGWSGDSVYGDARCYFGKPEAGRERLRRIIGEWKPPAQASRISS